MVSKVFKDRAKETASAATSGIYLELEGPADGFTGLPGPWKYFDYFITMLDGSGWEIGRGRIESDFPLPNKLAREDVYAEYNPNGWGHSGGALNFPAGAKEVSCVITANTMTQMMAMLESANNRTSYVFMTETYGNEPDIQVVDVGVDPVYPDVATVYEYTASASRGYLDGSSDSGADTAVVKQWKGQISVGFNYSVVPGESSQAVIQDIRGAGLDFALDVASGQFSVTLTGLPGETVDWRVVIRELARATLENTPA